MARIKKVSDLAAFQAGLMKKQTESEEQRQKRAEDLRLAKERDLAELKRKQAEKDQKQRDRNRVLRKKEEEASKSAFEAMRLAVGVEAESAGLFDIPMPSTSALRGAMIYARRAFENADTKTISMFEKFAREEAEALARARAERAARRAPAASDDRQDTVVEDKGDEPDAGGAALSEGGEAA